jgi:glycosyltransferase involved in cell wall biosynthesis
MSAPLVVVDADVLGRERTGDETHVRGLLRELAGALDLRFAAVTRHPELVPDGIAPLELRARSQVWRMAVALPLLLRRVRPALAHFQHALPFACPCPAVVTVHDLSFERDPSVMGPRDRLIFRTVVPRSARRAARVLTVSERTKRDLVDLYGAEAGRVVVTPNGVDPVFHPGDGPRDYVLSVGAIQRRKNQLAALDAAVAVGLPLVVAGPEKDPSVAAELRSRGARLEGYVNTARLAELYRGAACLVHTSVYEGFGLPVLESMASGTPVVAVREPALEEVAAGAAIFVEEDGIEQGIREALAGRDRLAAAGLERARIFTWRATAERTLAVYREVLGS